MMKVNASDHKQSLLEGFSDELQKLVVHLPEPRLNVAKPILEAPPPENWDGVFQHCKKR